MSRVEFASRILRELEIRSVLDVGCRESELSDHLPKDIVYAGADLFQNSRSRVTYVGDITSATIPQSYDAVVALDILEHVESPSKLFDRLMAVSGQYLLVSFPNCYDLKSRLRFLSGGPLGGKYVFQEQEPLDRHRWLMNRDEIVNWYNAKAAKHDLTVQVLDMTYGASSHSTIVGRAGRLFSKLAPYSMCTATVYGLFRRASH